MGIAIRILPQPERFICYLERVAFVIALFFIVFLGICERHLCTKDNFAPLYEG